MAIALQLANVVHLPVVARGLAVTEAQRRLVLRCTDLPSLDRWLVAAVVASSTREALALPKPARTVARRRRPAAWFRLRRASVASAVEGSSPVG